MSETKALGIIRRAVGREVSDREDTLRRAEMEHARKLITDEELADYKEDAVNGQIAKEIMEHALSLYQNRSVR